MAKTLDARIGGMLAEKEARAAVLAAAQGMLEHRITSGTSGNVSARLDGGTIVITPSGLPYRDMGLADLVVITMTGEPVSPGTASPHAAPQAGAAWPPRRSTSCIPPATRRFRR